MEIVRVAMIGFGGIARSHNKAYKKLFEEGASIKLVAVCDIDPSKFGGTVNINIKSSGSVLASDVHTYTDVEELLKKEEFDMADICLPSYLHKEYSIKMMRAGKHVLCEKPMALSGEECDEMLKVAAKTGRKLMIGQCLRFDPSYLYLKECIDSGIFGRLKNLHMTRFSMMPRWGFEHWFENTEKCGGCILDMHVHDVDMARFLLGEPDAVSSVSYDNVVRWAVINTRFYYDGIMVIADGSWDEANTVKFEMNYRARFEKASVIFNGKTTTVYPDEGEVKEAELPEKDRIAEEIRAFADSLLDENLVNTINTPESAAKTVKLVEIMRRSADNGGEIVKL